MIVYCICETTGLRELARSTIIPVREQRISFFLLFIRSESLARILDLLANFLDVGANVIRREVALIDHGGVKVETHGGIRYEMLFEWQRC